MTLNSLLKISLISVTAILAVSCGKSNGAKETDTFPSVMPEIVDTGTVDTTKREDGTSYVHFSNLQQVKNFMEKSGHNSEYQKGIIPQIASENLEYAEKLLNNTHNGFIVVDKGSMHVILYNKYGVEQKAYGMACARNFGTKHKKADSRTPEGFFSVEGIYDSTDWLFTNDNGYTSPARGQFGPRFIRLKIPTTSQIGIHGTAAPGSIGGRRSHGCIRLTNENILDLVKRVEKGMPVIVSPGPRDREVNAREGVSIYSVKTGYEDKMFKNIPDQTTVKEQKKSSAPTKTDETQETETPEATATETENPATKTEAAPAQETKQETTPEPTPAPKTEAPATPTQQGE